MSPNSLWCWCAAIFLFITFPTLLFAQPGIYIKVFDVTSDPAITGIDINGVVKSRGISTALSEHILPLIVCLKGGLSTNISPQGPISPLENDALQISVSVLDGNLCNTVGIYLPVYTPGSLAATITIKVGSTQSPYTTSLGMIGQNMMGFPLTIRSTGTTLLVEVDCRAATYLVENDVIIAWPGSFQSLTLSYDSLSPSFPVSFVGNLASSIWDGLKLSRNLMIQDGVFTFSLNSSGPLNGISPSVIPFTFMISDNTSASFISPFNVPYETRANFFALQSIKPAEMSPAQNTFELTYVINPTPNTSRTFKPMVNSRFKHTAFILNCVHKSDGNVSFVFIPNSGFTISVTATFIESVTVVCTIIVSGDVQLRIEEFQLTTENDYYDYNLFYTQFSTSEFGNNPTPRVVPLTPIVRATLAYSINLRQVYQYDFFKNMGSNSIRYRAIINFPGYTYAEPQNGQLISDITTISIVTPKFLEVDGSASIVANYKTLPSLSQETSNDFILLSTGGSGQLTIQFPANIDHFVDLSLEFFFDIFVQINGSTIDFVTSTSERPTEISGSMTTIIDKLDYFEYSSLSLSNSLQFSFSNQLSQPSLTLFPKTLRNKIVANPNYTFSFDLIFQPQISNTDGSVAKYLTPGFQFASQTQITISLPNTSNTFTTTQFEFNPAFSSGYDGQGLIQATASGQTVSENDPFFFKSTSLNLFTSYSPITLNMAVQHETQSFVVPVFIMFQESMTVIPTSGLEWNPTKISPPTLSLNFAIGTTLTINITPIDESNIGRTTKLPGTVLIELLQFVDGKELFISKMLYTSSMDANPADQIKHSMSLPFAGRGYFIRITGTRGAPLSAEQAEPIYFTSQYFEVKSACMKDTDNGWVSSCANSNDICLADGSCQCVIGVNGETCDRTGSICDNLCKSGPNTAGCNVFTGICTCNDDFFGDKCEQNTRCENTNSSICYRDHGYVSFQSNNNQCDNSKCTCYDNWGDVSCSSCMLQCNRGKADSKCSRCLCEKKYSGARCECMGLDTGMLLQAWSPIISHYFELENIYGSTTDRVLNFEEFTQFDEAKNAFLWIQGEIQKEISTLWRANSDSFSLKITQIPVVESEQIDIPFKTSIDLTILYNCPLYNPQSTANSIQTAWSGISIPFRQTQVVQNYFIFSQYLPEDDDGIEEKPVIDTPGEFEPEENGGRTVGYGFVSAICGAIFVSFFV
jgi:hypothetical protein